MDERIVIVKNDVGPGGFGLGATNPISLHTDSDHVYRITGMDQVEDIASCGYVRTKGYGVRAKVRGEIVYWTIGGDVYYYDKRPVLEIEANNIHDGQQGSVSIDDLSGIWVFNEEQNKYINEIDKYKQIYHENITAKMGTEMSLPDDKKITYKQFLEEIVFPQCGDNIITLDNGMEITIKDYFTKVVTPNVSKEDINYVDMLNIYKQLLVKISQSEEYVDDSKKGLGM